MTDADADYLDPGFVVLCDDIVEAVTIAEIDVSAAQLYAGQAGFLDLLDQCRRFGETAIAKTLDGKLVGYVAHGILFCVDWELFRQDTITRRPGLAK
jgi:hypothetical protein